MLCPKCVALMQELPVRELLLHILLQLSVHEEKFFLQRLILYNLHFIIHSGHKNAELYELK